MFRTILSIVIISACLFMSCGIPSPYYQKEEIIPQNAWAYDLKPDFKFDVTDTTSLYNIYFIVRHTDAYRFANIWMWIYTKHPGDTAFQRSRINIPMAESTGKWMGRGMGEIWEQRLPISLGDTAMLKHKGTYEIKLEQNMRTNPLTDILNVGLRVEKAGPRNFRPQ